MDGDSDERAVAGSPPAPSAEQLAAYVAANYGRFTDAAITSELTKAGYAVEDIRAALAQAARTAPPSQTGRAIATILAAYALTFALLSLGMLANSSISQGSYANSAIGIMILGVSLGVALLLSLAWVGSRRIAALILAVLIVLYGVGTLQAGLGGIIVIGLGVGLAVLVLRQGPSTRRSTATLGTLLAVPVILLVIITGLCVATGMPIPSAG
jgi:hypothetical protein